jgi:hypothetical protein
MLLRKAADDNSPQWWLIPNLTPLYKTPSGCTSYHGSNYALVHAI